MFSNCFYVEINQLKGFCTNSRGASVAASPEQLPSAAEIQKLESKLRTVVARAEQVLLHH